MLTAIDYLPTSSYYIVQRNGGALTGYNSRTGRDHAPTQSICDDLPEIEVGASSGATSGPDVASSADDDGDGDDDPDSDRRRLRSKKSATIAPPALLGFELLSHYVAFGRSRIYQLIHAGEFPPPIKIGKSSRWVRAEIDKWLSEKIAARTSNKHVGG